jgi:aflatoxin B1 aldehyde reductase
MREWLAVCEEHGYIKPTVYQGEYNAIDRQAQKELFPLLRENNIRIIAYGYEVPPFLITLLTL